VTAIIVYWSLPAAGARSVAVIKDDLILISVDDHIAEPADMFDAHVPAKYKDLAPRVVTESDGIQQWYYGEVRGRNMGLNALAGKPARCTTSTSGSAT